MSHLNNTLLIVAHPNPTQSKFNQAWAQTAKESGCHVHFLASNMHEDMFDPQIESDLLLSHQYIALCFPLWWYNMPWLLSKWFAQVITDKFAYGKSFDLEGKTLSCLISCGGPAHAYSHQGLAHKTIAEFIPSIPAIASYCHMKYRDPFVFYGTHGASEQSLAQSCEQALDHLNALASH
ncbi:MAG: NAD(P)H-dependent oxidoreductase [Spirochaetia bacterium]